MKFLVVLLAITCVFAGPTRKGQYRTETDCVDCFEGDMKLVPGQRNGLTDTRYRWTNNQVAYQFAAGFDATNQATIEATMADISARTNDCITFNARSIEDNYIRFTNLDSSGCFSYVGMIGGSQQINYPQWCVDQVGSRYHEILHALGFYHMQSDSTRDDYVEIMWDNIQAGAENNFAKQDAADANLMGTAYEYESVMHYSGYAFSTNGEYTIVTKDPAYQDVIGQRDDISDQDLRRLTNMYGCTQP